MTLTERTVVISNAEPRERRRHSRGVGPHDSEDDRTPAFPGIEGRWEYHQAAVDALARSFRVLTFALCGEPASALHDPRGAWTTTWIRPSVSSTRGIDRAVVCGVSFGGLAAVRFAAMHPERTSSLVVVSTPAPVPG